MINEWKKLANYTKEHNLDLEINAINISKTNAEAIAAPYYPYLVLYSKGPIEKAAAYEEFNWKEEKLLAFIKSKGI